ncbi:MAG TPA: hypothetical protein VFV67_08465 [Actinophytocola sp.]|uniref:hypothetical protein n=1 Tax=Actinophytocola sp. TaxID=1872138 RepID=UPI002DB67A2D|nr:hypothetical protein [Actinophytocola sp.]HEU5470673.1 hypothetical protein [Actinophytocola sp.]
MRTATKLTAYGLAVAVVAAGAWAVGTAVGPVDGAAEAGHPMTEQAHGDPAPHAEEALPGLAVAAGGYRLELGQDRVAVGEVLPLRYRILGPDGAPVTRFEVEQDKLMHLVTVRRDGSNYRHVHPELAPDGTWSIALNLPEPGSYRMFADFKPAGGADTTLGTDLHVTGEYLPRSFDSPQRTFTVAGYQVRLDGELVAGAESTVTATVTKDGQPVTDLQRYLGAYGHLVTLRAADLGYLHVHPLGGTPGGPDTRFAVEVPTPGRYRMFLDFQHRDTVHTAEFTVEARS